LEKVENKLGINIVRVGRSLEEIIAEHGFFLPGPRARYCTRQAKIDPYIKWVGDSECTTYFGIRADEKRIGFNNSKNKNIIPEYPLIPAGIGIKEVYDLVIGLDLLPPTFIWDRLVSDIQERYDTPLNKLLPPWVYHTLFSGRSRNNCFFCHFQKESEWAWLCMERPELFEKARAI